MYILKAQCSFDSAHFLKNYSGKCSNLHGHRWTIEASVKSDILELEGQLEGMVVDFGDIKKSLKTIADEFDHSLIIQNGTMKPLLIEMLEGEGFKNIIVDFRPTAENFAFYFHERLKAEGFRMHEVTVFETPTNSATYMED